MTCSERSTDLELIALYAHDARRRRLQSSVSERLGSERGGNTPAVALNGLRPLREDRIRVMAGPNSEVWTLVLVDASRSAAKRARFMPELFCSVLLMIKHQDFRERREEEPPAKHAKIKGRL